ncbi:MAG TPA: hypothetical protein PLS03_05020 [Terrimicrobiaceae bacterium]|nr:hypothetical protein [Terrimicrobiaceae bacterium]
MLSHDLQIEIGDARIEMLTIALPEKINDGWIIVGNVYISNCPPVPFFEKNIVSMTIVPATESAPIKIEGSSIKICAIGDAVYVESFSGSTK